MPALSAPLTLVRSRWLPWTAASFTLAAALAALAACRGWLLALQLVMIAAGTLRGLPSLVYGRGRALSRLQWRPSGRWRLTRGDGATTQATLHPASRRVGRAVLLVFEGATALIGPHMVSDPDAARRLRMQFTLGTIRAGRRRVS
ncbi:MAG: hypothetical protein U1F35_11890 [Steroidobacteraceae bacterium]